MYIMMSVNGTGDDGYQEKENDAEIIITKLNSLEFNFIFIHRGHVCVCVCVCASALDINIY